MKYNQLMSLRPEFITKLRRLFSGDIRLDLASRILYSTYASIYQIEPLGGAIPKTQKELCLAGNDIRLIRLHASP
jgi:hypothetical protein